MAKNRKGHSKPSSSSEQAVEISEEEQWRIINDTGILKKVPQATQVEQLAEEEAEEESILANEIFNAVTLIIPMSSLLLLMEILVHYQYGREPSYRDLMDRMLPSVPILSIFIFYTSRYKQHRRMQAAFFLLSTFAGSRLIWLLNRANWRMVMKQSPPLATIWIYAIVQLELGPATLSLIVVYAWMWYKKMKLFL